MSDKKQPDENDIEISDNNIDNKDAHLKKEDQTKEKSPDTTPEEDNLFTASISHKKKSASKLWVFILFLFTLLAGLITGYIYNIAGLRDHAKNYNFYKEPFSKQIPTKTDNTVIPSPTASDKPARSISIHKDFEYPQKDLTQKKDTSITPLPELPKGTSKDIAKDIPKESSKDTEKTKPIAMIPTPNKEEKPITIEKKTIAAPVPSPTLSEENLSAAPLFENIFTPPEKSDIKPSEPIIIIEKSINMPPKDNDKNINLNDFKEHREIIRNMKMALYRGDGYVDELIAVKNLFPEIQLPVIQKYATAGFSGRVRLAFAGVTAVQKAFKQKDLSQNDLDVAPHSIKGLLKKGLSYFISVSSSKDNEQKNKELLDIEKAFKLGKFKEVKTLIKNLPKQRSIFFEDIIKRLNDDYQIKLELKSIEDNMMHKLYPS